jgi:carbon storage regulator
LGAVFSSDNRTFTWTPNFTQAGSYPDVRFEVTDGFLTDSENITITVIDIRGDKVRLGIEAPIDKSVHRLEVYQEIQKQEAVRQECLQREKNFIEKNK